MSADPTARLGKTHLEETVESFLVKRVRLLGGQTIKLAPMEKGIPDRLVMLPGGFLALVELKAPDGVLSPKQKHWHAKALENQGIRVYVLSSKGEVLVWLRAVIDAMGPQSRRGSSSVRRVG